MNRQVRIATLQEQWVSYGSVGHYEAIRMHIGGWWLNKIKLDEPVTVETRDKDDPSEPIGVVQVIPRLHVEFVNPRQGAKDEDEEKAIEPQAVELLPRETAEQLLGQAMRERMAQVEGMHDWSVIQSLSEPSDVIREEPQQ